jgi:hypothetical protein
MQTSILDFLLRAREKPAARSWLWHVLQGLVASLISLVAIGTLALSLSGWSFGWAILISFGGVLAQVGLFFGVFLLGAVSERLEKERGVTLSAVIRSSGFALMRSQPKPPEGQPLTFVIGAGASAPQGISISEYMEGPSRRKRLRKFNAALRSSGFSVIREELPDKDRIKID